MPDLSKTMPLKCTEENAIKSNLRKVTFVTCRIVNSKMISFCPEPSVTPSDWCHLACGKGFRISIVLKHDGQRFGKSLSLGEDDLSSGMSIKTRFEGSARLQHTAGQCFWLTSTFRSLDSLFLPRKCLVGLIDYTSLFASIVGSNYFLDEVRRTFVRLLYSMNADLCSVIAS